MSDNSTLIGLKRRATIIKYNGDGTVEVNLDGTSSNKDNTHTVSIPLAFSGPNGEFMGGIPNPRTPVTIAQGQGEWFIAGYTKPDNIYSNRNTTGTAGTINNLMGELAEGRLLLQTEYATNRFYVDPIHGIHSGTSNSEHIIDNRRDIVTHNLSNEMAFTSAHRSIKGIIKRDLQDSTVKGLDSSILESPDYDDSLTTIGMDPTTATSICTVAGNVRNLPLVENREITYEFENLSAGIDADADSIEANRYSDNVLSVETFPNKTDSRATAFSLNLHYPNHLIEEIKGTGVDSFGNILDLNRSILPIGREDDYTFTKNPDNIDAYKKIRAMSRRSLAHHFEINTRKQDNQDEIYQVPNSSNHSNYSRSRSTYYHDIDKEGVFKLNIPMSSETGNIPLPTRYINASVLAYDNKDVSDPNAFVTEEDNIDIYLENYANTSNIKIKGESEEVGPIDRFTDAPIRLGTVYHDIMQAGYQFTKKRLADDAGGKLVRYMPDSMINERQDIIQLQDFVTNEIIQSGPNANAGGRSGMINTDGMITVNIGANTVDKQSLWIDTAGGVISQLGKDKRGISYMGTLDGDLMLQIGKGKISGDSRFIDETNTAGGTLDIRVVNSSEQLAIIRIDDTGVYVTSPGRVEISAQQQLMLKSNTEIAMEAPLISVYSQSGSGIARTIKRTGNDI